ncbi:hypothetical protein D3C78_391680 [compost metagenome]
MRSVATRSGRERMIQHCLRNRVTFMAQSYLAHHLQLLHHLRTILVALGESEQVPEESHVLFLERFDELLTHLPTDPLQSQYLGQDLICQVIQRYPQIAHLVPRDLLWFFGGDCLHFMPDEELELYQQLEEMRYEAEQQGETFDWHQHKEMLSLSNRRSAH